MLFWKKTPPAPVRPKPLINLEDARARHPDPEVPSPCISVCQMNAERGLCSGCYRTLDEIGRWSTLGETERLQVWIRIEDRQI